MDDARADAILLAVQHLAIVLRAGNADEILEAATEAFTAAEGDCTAALVVAAAMVPVDRPLDTWWIKADPDLKPCPDCKRMTRPRSRPDLPAIVRQSFGKCGRCIYQQSKHATTAA